MADKKHLSLILGNATRLLDDARLLVDHRRYASAFALEVMTRSFARTRGMTV